RGVVGWAGGGAVLRGALGHSVHPMLTDVTLGCWPSASILDRAGGAGARSSATLPVGFALIASGPTAVPGTGGWAELSGTERRSAQFTRWAPTLQPFFSSAPWSR